VEGFSFALVLAASLPKPKQKRFSALPQAKKGGCGRHRKNGFEKGAPFSKPFLRWYNVSDM
jgi:hypothetical protein